MTTYSWIGLSGSYGTTADWSPTPTSPGGIPENGASIIFGGTNTYMVTINEQATDGGSGLDEVSLADPNATIVFNGAGVPIEAGSFAMSAGTLDIQFDAGIGGSLDLFGPQELSGGVINFSVDGGIGVADATSGSTITAPAILTLGPTLTVNELQGVGAIDCGGSSVDSKLTNEGTINALASNGATLSIGTDMNSKNAGFNNQGALNAGGNSTFNVNGYVIDNSGDISVLGQSAFEATFADFTNTGTIAVSSAVGFTASSYGGTDYDFINDGSVVVDGGLFDLSQGYRSSVANFAVSGTGSIDISGGGSFLCWGGDDLTENITFEGAGNLSVYSSVGADVVGFAAGDSIDFDGLSFFDDYSQTYAADLVWLSTANGVQTFAMENTDGEVMTTVKLVGHHAASQFQVVDDGLGHAEIVETGHAGPASDTDDFNGSGASDLLFRSSTGALATWEMNNTAIIGGGLLGNPGSSWTYEETGDFNDDGKADILFQNTAGVLALWEMNGTSIIGGGAIGAPGGTFAVVGVGDFNGDGATDILFRNASGKYAIWEMNGATIVGGGVIGAPGSAWTFKGVGDFNGDGKSDLLFENVNGQYATWLMNGSQIVGGSTLGTPGADWVFKGVGNFNGLGESDILFENTATGVYATWNIANDAISGGGTIGAPGAAWAFKAIGDYNGDSMSDILFQNTATGAYATWNLNNTTIIGGGTIGNPGSAYTIA